MSEAPKLVHAESDKVWLQNDGDTTVFYGHDRKDPIGKIDPGHCKAIPKNCVWWVARGQANVRFL